MFEVFCDTTRPFQRPVGHRQSPHPACQEGALHGLGHWGEHAPNRAQELIDMFLSENRAARPELVAYARAARGGCIQ